MKQPHIQLDESLNVRYAILPGDPRRAERIASHMSEVEDLGMNREYRSLVGAYRARAFWPCPRAWAASRPASRSRSCITSA